MYDPFIDSFNEQEPLQTPLVPSRSATPSTAPIASATPPDPASLEDAAALFDPLASLPTNSRISTPPTTSVSTRATPKASYDPGAQPKRRPGMLTISTPSNPPPPSTVGDPLEDLLGTKGKEDSSARPKPTRKFSTTPLFQPPPMPRRKSGTPPLSHIRRTPPPQQVQAHARGASDDFGSFVSVPRALDPLSNASPTQPTPLVPSQSTDASSGSIHQQPLSNAATTIANEFTLAAKQRHAENAERILGEFARSEAVTGSGDFLGLLDDAVRSAEEEGQNPSEVLEKTLKVEEGPPSPPATPTEGPPPKMKSPKNRGESSSAERAERKEAPHAGGYFPPTVPRRITGLMTNSSATATTQMSPSSHVYGQGGTSEADRVGGLLEDPYGIMAMPASSSVARLSSIPPQPHPQGLRPTAPMVLSTGNDPASGSSLPYSGITRSATFPAGGGSMRGKTIPDAFLTHRTPFASVKYIPPSGAPGYTGEEGWDTGGFAADWEDEGHLDASVDALARRAKEMKKKSVPRVMKLLGRRESTAGVLTRGLSDALRPRLPALARLCTSWTLLYSMDQHGILLHTFYNLSSPSATSTNKVSGGRKGALLVIRDAFDGVFGAWIGEGIRMSMSGEGHFGGGDSFLWRTSSVIPDPHDEKGDDELPVIEVFKWTGRNDYIALCEPDFVSLGGGEDGKTGIYLASSLLDGSSAKCMTFDNEVLCAEEGDAPNGQPGMGVSRLEGRTAKFEIIGLEVWGLVAS